MPDNAQKANIVAKALSSIPLATVLCLLIGFMIWTDQWRDTRWREREANMELRWVELHSENRELIKMLGDHWEKSNELGRTELAMIKSQLALMERMIERLSKDPK